MKQSIAGSGTTTSKNNFILLLVGTIKQNNKKKKYFSKRERGGVPNPSTPPDQPMITSIILGVSWGNSKTSVIAN